MQFTEAVRYGSKGRLALMGPSGSGKTYTGLLFAHSMGERVAVLDTEHGSASKYVGENGWAFDVLELQSFNPKVYIDAIHAAEEAEYDVLLIDSLSHAWTGKDGALEMVDKAAARSKGNSYVGWRDVTPLHNQMIDAIVGSELHIIATMRTKMEYVQEKNEKTGKTEIRKIGLQPVQRDGMEYEFDLVCDIDTDHRLVVGKTRCRDLDGVVQLKPDAKTIAPFVSWLDGEERPAPPVEKDDGTVVLQFSEAINDQWVSSLEGNGFQFSEEKGASWRAPVTKESVKFAHDVVKKYGDALTWHRVPKEAA